MKLSTTFFLSTAVLSFLSTVSADIYFQSPCGGNDRLNEVNRNVQTNNRLWDSQNNNRGGCTVGQQPLQVYAGSQIPLQWTSQHACGGTQDNCDLIIQYMTDQTDASAPWGKYNIRDGTSTNQPPDNSSADNDPQYGLHESRAYYDTCKNTQRDPNLFTSDQNLNGQGKTATLQNAAGNRNGFECAEERDYYPSAVPNPWVDVVAMVSNQNRCDTILATSQNTAPTYYCNTQGGNIPITQAACQSQGGTWTTVAAKNLPAPQCIVNNQIQRDNSHSVAAGTGGLLSNYVFTVPQDAIGKQLILRIRYNISTGEFGNPATGALPVGVTAIDKSANRVNGQVGLNVYSAIGLNQQQAVTRNYVLSGDTRVDVIGTLDDPINANGQLGSANTKTNMELAIATNQWFRTFQDRTFIMKVLDPASNPIVSQALASGNKVINIGVMGHNGNSVQVYPQQLTQFSPSNLNVTLNDVVQFQWSLTKYNPVNNAEVSTQATSQGTLQNIQSGTENANVVMLAAKSFVEDGDISNPFQEGAAGRWTPAAIDSTNPQNNFLGQPAALVAGLANGGQSYNSGPILLTQEGIFPYMSTLSSDSGVAGVKGIITVSGPGLAAFDNSATNILAIQTKMNKLAAAAPPPDSPQGQSQLATQQAPAAATYANRPNFSTSSSSSSGPNIVLIGAITGAVAGFILVIFLVYIFCLKGKIVDKSMKSVAYTAPKPVAYTAQKPVVYTAPQYTRTIASPTQQPMPYNGQKPSLPPRYTRNDFV